MKAAETKRTAPIVSTPTKQSSKPSGYERVFDGRKQRVRGLWKRGQAFYARFAATDQSGRTRDTFRALDSATVAAAKAELHALREAASNISVPVQGRTPTFSDFSKRYLEEVSGNKRPATQRKERKHVAWWTDRIGAHPINRVHRSHVNTGIADLTKSGLSPRTVNLYVITLRSVLKRGMEEGLLAELPTQGLRPLKVSGKKRELVPLEIFHQILTASFEATKNAPQFCDYFRLLLCTGAREQESLRIRWADIDWKNRLVTIGADGLSKNHESRTIDFNPDLEVLLKEMESRRVPGSQWLFPSPQRGEKDIPSKTFRESLKLACAQAGMPRIGFHDARHYFVSACVMAGVDFMTIASWVGHKDGGVLIGRVYGHLAGGHRQSMAAKLGRLTA
jgi:integrase